MAYQCVSSSSHHKDDLIIFIDIPVMTLGIKKCTIGKTRSLAYALFYAMLTTGLFLSGPIVDIIRTNMPSKLISV